MTIRPAERAIARLVRPATNIAFPRERNSSWPWYIIIYPAPIVITKSERTQKAIISLSMILERTLLTVHAPVPPARVSPPGVKSETFIVKFGVLIQSEVIHSAAEAEEINSTASKKNRVNIPILRKEKTFIGCISKINSEILIKKGKYTNSFSIKVTLQKQERVYTL